MTNNKLQRILKSISRENLYSYNFHDGQPVTYDALEMWQIFDKLLKRRELTVKEDIQYMKGLTVAVVDAIRNKYGKLPDGGKGEFQLDYLASNILLLKDYYERNLVGTIFKWHMNPPLTPSEQKDFKGFLLKKASLLISSRHSYDFEKALRKDGIDYKKYKEALVMAEISGTTATIDINDFRDRSVNVEIKESIDEVADYCESTFFFDDYDLNEVEVYLEPIPGMITDKNSVDIENIAKSFGLYDLPKMRQLFKYFDNNRISEVDPGYLWDIKYFDLDMTLLWKIYKALYRGACLSKDGKEFLIMQFFMIALSVYKNHKLFIIDDEEQKASLNRDQMILMTKVVSDGYVYFNKNYKSTILTVEHELQRELIFMKVREYFVMRINKLLKTPQVSTAIPMAKMMKAKITIDDIQKLNLEEVFESEELYSAFITKIAMNLSGEVLSELLEELKDDISNLFSTEGEYIISRDLDLIFCDYSQLKAYLSDNNIELSTIFNFLNPESQKEKQDYTYITRGVISALTTGIMSQFKKEDGKLQITLTNGESSLNLEKLAEASTTLLKAMVDKEFDIKRGDVSALAKTVISEIVNEIDVPFSVPVPSESEYESFKTMVDMNGPIKVSIPFSPKGDRPFWDDEKVLDDKMVQMIDKSITDLINASNINKAILLQL